MKSNTEIMRKIDDAVKNFTGNSAELESAIGAFLVGRHIGWKPLYLMHDKKTLRAYEKHLDLEFRTVLPEIGALASKCVAWDLAQKAGNFWKSVTGNIKGVRSSQIV